ncbi:MAG: GBS Bsp-like repeat-containing protein [Lachnospiraceae bacterium]|nr:GBS Bsp-like repeat-containing protein [Lachnospiraceae bacterium]
MYTLKKRLSGLLVLLLVLSLSFPAFAEERFSQGDDTSSSYEVTNENSDFSLADLERETEHTSLDFEEHGDSACCTTEDDTDTEPTDLDLEEALLDFVFIDEQSVHILEEQHIAIGFADETLEITSATLYARSTVTYEQLVFHVTNIVGSGLLFSIDHSTHQMEDEILLESIDYTVDGDDEIFSLIFTDHGIDASYRITLVGETDSTDISIHSINEAGAAVFEITDLENLEDSLEDILQLVDPDLDEYDLVFRQENELVEAITDITPFAAAGQIESSAAEIIPLASDIVIVVSAGHCRTHPGAHSPSHLGTPVLHEYQLNWEVAGIIVTELNRHAGVRAYRDRSAIQCAFPGHNTSHCVTQRIHNARSQRGADVFVDIHFNAGGGTGAEVFYPNNSVNRRIHEEGRELATDIVNRLAGLGLHNRGAKTWNNTWGATDNQGRPLDFLATNRIAKELGMVGILVESAFLDHPNDVARLRNPQFRRDIALAIAAGIVNTYGLRIATAPQVRIINQNDFTGTAEIRYSGFNGGDIVRIWSEANNQNDMRSFTVPASGAGTIDFRIQDFQNRRGTFLIQVMRNGNAVHNSTFHITNPAATLTARDSDGTQRNFVLELTFQEVPVGITRVQIPVWTNPNQNDIQWYDATRVGNTNTWRTTANISNHRLAGRYTAHAWVTMSNGINRFVAGTFFDVAPTTVGSMQVRNINQNAGTFDVVLENLQSPSGINRINIGVWSQANQNDLRWYTGVRQPNGSFRIAVNIANHNFNRGTYHIHAHITAGNGHLVVRGITHHVTMPRTNVITRDTNGRETIFALSTVNTAALGPMRSVQFAVWTEANNQTDLRWINATRNSNGLWEANADVRHFNGWGRHLVHAWGVNNSGQRVFIGGSHFNVTAPQVNRIAIQPSNHTQGPGTFGIVLDDIDSASGVSRIDVAAWSQNNQGDLVWTRATRRANGGYVANFNVANHNFNSGRFHIHAHIITGNGNRIVRGTTQMVPALRANVTARDSNGRETIFNLSSTTIREMGAMRNVQFAVWSANGGQNDLVWYNATQNNNGLWVTNANINNHNSSGRYYVHVWGTRANGQRVFKGGTTFQVSPIGGANISVNHTNSSTGTFDVIIRNLNHPSGINRVQVPIWSLPNQADIHWHTATRHNDGSFRVRVNPGQSHRNNNGNFHAHVWVRKGNHISGFAGGTRIVVRNQSGSRTPIMGASQATRAQMIRAFQNTGRTYPSTALGRGGAPTIESFVDILMQEAAREGVRAEVVFAQAMHETGWLQFNNIVTVDMFNFGGLGALDNNQRGEANRFPSVRMGLRAQVQHLKGYASTATLRHPTNMAHPPTGRVNGSYSPRFHYIRQRGMAPYVEWLAIGANPNFPNHGWATNPDYGIHITNLLRRVLAS